MELMRSKKQQLVDEQKALEMKYENVKLKYSSLYHQVGIFSFKFFFVYCLYLIYSLRFIRSSLKPHLRFLSNKIMSACLVKLSFPSSPATAFMRSLTARPGCSISNAKNNFPRVRNAVEKS